MIGGVGEAVPHRNDVDIPDQENILDTPLRIVIREEVPYSPLQVGVAVIGVYPGCGDDVDMKAEHFLPVHQRHHRPGQSIRCNYDVVVP